MHEFQIIEHYFSKQPKVRHDVICGIGDDAAILRLPENNELVVTTDTLLEGVHFFSDAAPEDIGYKALAVNLSDLAAMGALPAWAMLSLTLPKANDTWLAQFRTGFFTLIQQYGMQLVGGDMTHGPLSMTVQAFGFVPPGCALLRSGARPGDFIYVTGEIGDAGLALQLLTTGQSIPDEAQSSVMQRLLRPTPRVKEGIALRGVASAAIDISDGLAADLQHLLQQSGVGATVVVEDLPLSATLRATLPSEKAIALALSSGDDYELCFTSPTRLPQYVCIGVIEATQGLRLRHRDGKNFQLDLLGYQHF